jgi:hypothetical protein
MRDCPDVSIHFVDPKGIHSIFGILLIWLWGQPELKFTWMAVKPGFFKNCRKAKRTSLIALKSGSVR